MGSEFSTLLLYLFYMFSVMLSYRIKWKKWNWYAIISFTLLLGLRSNGLDYNVYNQAFQKLVNNASSLFSKDYVETLKYSPVHFEFGHLAIIKIISFCSNNSIFFFSSLAFIQIVATDRFIQDYNKRTKSLMIFFFFTTLIFCNVFNGMRQFAAFLLYINSYRFIVQRDLKKYVISVLAIALVHTSILIMLPFYFFIHKDFLTNKKIQCFVYLMVVFRANLFMEKLRSVLYVLNYASNEGYSGYFQREEFDLNAGVSPFVIFFRLVTFFFILSYSKALKQKHGPLGIIIYNVCYIGYILQELSFNLAVLRLNFYFYYVVFAVMALISYDNLYGISKSRKTILVTYGMILLHVAWFANCVLKGAGGCAPYALSKYL